MEVEVCWIEAGLSQGYIYIYIYTGMLFVVDSSDKDRIWEARQELYHMLEEEIQGRIPCIVLANKQDMPGK